MPTTGQSRRFRFTHQLIADLPPHDPASPSREAEYSDEEVRGLRLLVSKTNRKTFFLRYVLDQRKGVVRIGEWPAMSLKDARTRAHELKGRIAHGEDPREDKPLRVAMPTVEEFALGDFMTWAKVHKRSWRDDEIRFHKEIIPRIGKRRLSDLTTRDVPFFVFGRKTVASSRCTFSHRSVRASPLRSPVKSRNLTAAAMERLASPSSAFRSAPISALDR